MTEPDLFMLASAQIESSENSRTAQQLVLTSLSGDMDALLDEIEALPADYQPGVLAALANVAGIYLALACGKDKKRAAAFVRQQLADGG